MSQSFSVSGHIQGRASPKEFTPSYSELTFRESWFFYGRFVHGESGKFPNRMLRHELPLHSTGEIAYLSSVRILIHHKSHVSLEIYNVSLQVHFQWKSFCLFVVCVCIARMHTKCLCAISCYSFWIQRYGLSFCFGPWGKTALSSLYMLVCILGYLHCMKYEFKGHIHPWWSLEFCHVLLWAHIQWELVGWFVCMCVWWELWDIGGHVI